VVSYHHTPPQPLHTRLRLALHGSGGNKLNPLIHHQRGRYSSLANSRVPDQQPQRFRILERTQERLCDFHPGLKGATSLCRNARRNREMVLADENTDGGEPSRRTVGACWGVSRPRADDVVSRCGHATCWLRRTRLLRRLGAAPTGNARLSRTARRRRCLRRRDMARGRRLPRLGADQARRRYRTGYSPCACPRAPTTPVASPATCPRGRPQPPSAAGRRQRQRPAGNPRVDRCATVRNTTRALQRHPARTKELVERLPRVVARRALLLPRLGNPRLRRCSRPGRKSRLHSHPTAPRAPSFPGNAARHTGHHPWPPLTAPDRSLATNTRRPVTQSTVSDRSGKLPRIFRPAPSAQRSARP
jgi:hypothetical protein